MALGRRNLNNISQLRVGDTIVEDIFAIHDDVVAFYKDLYSDLGLLDQSLMDYRSNNWMSNKGLA